MEGGRMLAVHARTGSRARLPRALGLAVAVTVALTSCSPFGSVAMKATTATDLANQKKAALLFISDWPETERIRYTQEGGFSRSGSRSAYATVTIAGNDYGEHLGLDLVGGDPLPAPDARATPSPVPITYSDGSSEVLG
jgi:hypothetical protein